MSEQLPLEQEYSPCPNFNHYKHWILTVGELREKLRCHSDDTLVKIAADGKTSFGDRIDITLPISNISFGGRMEYKGEKRNLIYISGVGYPQEGVEK